MCSTVYTHSMLSTAYPYMLWVIYRGLHFLCCGTHDLYAVDDIVVVHTIYILCCPQHILHSIWISCCPHHILRVVHTIKMVTHSISGICCGESRISVFYAVDTIFICSGGVDSVHMVWTTHMLWTICRGQHVHIPWVTLVMLWVYDVGTPSSDIWCGLPYAVDYRCPHHIQPVVHSIYMVWVYAVGAHEFCRCVMRRVWY